MNEDSHNREMKSLRQLLTLISLTTLLACTNPSTTEVAQDGDAATVNHSTDSLSTADTAKQHTPNDRATTGNTPATALLMESFTTLPAEIQGCGCYFSADEEQYKRNAYVFVAGYDSVAFITLDQKKVRLKMVSSTRNPATFGDYDHVEVYAGDQYKVTVDIKYKKSSGEETWQNEGTITLETNDGQKKVQPFFGECGC